MVCADLDASIEKLKEAAQKIINLEEALRFAWEEEWQLKGNVHVKYTFLAAAEKEVDEKSKVLVDLKVVPTLWLNDAKELERYEKIMLEMQSSLNAVTWMDSDWFIT